MNVKKERVILNVYSPRGRRLVLLGTPETRVHQIIAAIFSKIEDKMKTPRLFYDGVELWFDETLEKHKITLESFVVMTTDVELPQVTEREILD